MLIKMFGSAIKAGLDFSWKTMGGGDVTWTETGDVILVCSVVP